MSLERPHAFSSVFPQASAFNQYVPPVTSTASLNAGTAFGYPAFSPTQLASPIVVSPQSLFSPTGDASAGTPGACQICQDKATGKHYGAVSCDGCKGFFRRTIRKSQRYACRYNRNCAMDKDKRNSCRYCRYKKCVEAGMKREAVQNERDRITTGSKSGVSSRSGNIETLMQAENATVNLRSSVIRRTHQLRLAHTNDISESMKQQLLLLVEWAKNLPAFGRLEMNEKVGLLRSYGAQHLLLGVARRSVHADGHRLLLGNDTFISRDVETELPDIRMLTGRVLDEIVQPMQDMQIDESEFVLLKAIIFFNPHAYQLSKSKSLIASTRQSLIASLEAHIMEGSNVAKGRLGNIYLLLPSLQMISHQMVQSLQTARFFGFAHLDSLLTEILFAEDAGKVQSEVSASVSSFQLPVSSYSNNDDVTMSSNSMPSSPDRRP